MIKTYEVSYRKRGLPESDLQTLEVLSESYAGAVYQAGRQVGEEYVIVLAKLKKEGDSKDEVQ